MSTSFKDRLLTRLEILAYLGIDRATLKRWLETKQFPPPIPFGPRTARWREIDIRVWENERLKAECERLGITVGASYPPPPGAMTADELRAEADRLDAIEAAEKEKVSTG